MYISALRSKFQLPAFDSLTRRDAALFLVGLAPIVAMLIIVVRNWLPLPFWDEWMTPGGTFVAWSEGTLSWQHMFSQHNESRKFFPRLLYLALVQFGGWDVRKEMALTFLSVTATTVLFWRLMRKLPGATSRSALFVWIAAAFLCFSAVQFENFLWGVQVEVFFPGLALLAMAAVNLSNLSLPRKALVNGVLALMATYTAAHGMLLWFLGAPLLAPAQSLRETWRIYLAYFGCAAVAIGAYFIDYHHVLRHPALFGGQLNALGLGHYLVLWAGSYFNSPSVDPLIIGAIAILVFLGALAGAIAIIRHTRDWRPFYVPLIIAAYACATAAIIAAGRIGFGVNQALEIRYRVFSLSFYLAIVALLFAIYVSWIRQSAPTTRRVYQSACVFLAVASLAGWTLCYADGVQHLHDIHQRDLVSLRALEWVEVIPDNPNLSIVFPDPEVGRIRAQILRERHILRLPFVDDEVAQAVRQVPLAPADASFGTIQNCHFNSDLDLVIAGRARIPRHTRKPDCVVIDAIDSAGVVKPIGVLETNRPNEKGFAYFLRALKPTNLPPGELKIAAWAIDLKDRKAYPLAGTATINSPMP